MIHFKRSILLFTAISFLQTISYGQQVQPVTGEWIGALVKNKMVSPLTVSLYEDASGIRGLVDYPDEKRFNLPSSVHTVGDSLIITRYSATETGKITGYFRGVVKDSTYSGLYVAANNSTGPFLLVKNNNALAKQQPVPDFIVPPLTESSPPVHLASFKGKYLLVDFWATYCSTCIAKRMELDSIHKKYGDDLQIISISLDKEAATVAGFRKEKFAMPWTQGFVKHDFDHPFCKLFGIDMIGTPGLFLLSPGGQLLAKTEELLSKGIDNVLKNYLTDKR